MNLDLGDGFAVREFRDEDAEALVVHGNNPKVASNLEDRFPHPYSPEHARKWLDRVAEQDPLTHFAITCDDQAIGAIGFQLREDVYRCTADMGYWIGETFWGQGIVPRAVRAITVWAFETFDIARMQARVFDSNPASCRVLEKAGFRFEGRLRQSVVKKGVLMDQLVYAILRPESEALKKS